MDIVFKIEDNSPAIVDKKEIRRVYESFQSRVSDYSRNAQVPIQATLIINPAADAIVVAERISEDKYIVLEDSLRNAPKIQDLIGRLRFFKISIPGVTSLLFRIQSPSSKTIAMDSKLNQTEVPSIEKLLIEEGAINRLKDWLFSYNNSVAPNGFVCIAGPSGVGKTYTAKTLCKELGKRARILDIKDLFGKIGLDDILSNMPQNAVVILDNIDSLFYDLANRRDLQYEMSRKRSIVLDYIDKGQNLFVVVLSSISNLPIEYTSRLSLLLKLDLPSDELRRRIINDYCTDPQKSIDLSSRTAGFTTRELINLIFQLNSVSSGNDLSLLSSEIINSIADKAIKNRELIFSPDGNDFKITKPTITLDKVVLAQEKKKTLLTALSSIVNESLIYDTWGFRDIDPNVRSIINFFGPPGTGKTMCANAIANTLSTLCGRPFELLSLNYSEVESMYVGEAPKKLEKVFNFARGRDLILFFDEADSFLGKRISNVSQGSEQAINSLRSTMLIQLEKYNGVVIFATNLATNYDPAFKTRFLAEIEFSLPDESTCVEIFKKSIPEKMLPYMLPIEDAGWSRLGSVAIGLSGRDIKTIIWRVLAKAALKDGVEHQFIIEEIINETESYKAEKYNNTKNNNDFVETKDIKVSPTEDAAIVKEKLSKIANKK